MLASIRRCFIVFLIVGCAASQSLGGMLNAIDRGYYQNDGRHVPTLTNYFVGQSDRYRNFFVFDVTGISASDQFVSAQLKLYNKSGFNSYQTPTTTYELYDYSGSVADLVDGVGGANAFQDLGTGTKLGAAELSSADVNTFVSISLNSAGIAALNAARGGFFSLGGRLTSLDLTYAFGDSGTPLSDGWSTLVFETQPAATIPEPSTVALFGLGSVAVGLIKQRRKRRVLSRR